MWGSDQTSQSSGNAKQGPTIPDRTAQTDKADEVHKTDKCSQDWYDIQGWISNIQGRASSYQQHRRARHNSSSQRMGRSPYPNEPSPNMEPFVKKSLIYMLFSQSGSRSANENTWFAEVDIETTDLSKVMKEGLHWTEENLDREAGYLIMDLDKQTPRVYSPLIESVRVYVLRDVKNEPPLWTARMQVGFPDPQGAARFRFSDVFAPTQVVECKAYNRDGKRVYDFTRGEGVVNFNTFFEDMPLKGWWPWPEEPARVSSNVSENTEWEILVDSS